MARTCDSRDAEEDFRDEGLSQGEQFGDAADNLRLINDAEKVFEEEHAFEAPEEIPPFPSHQVWSLKFTAFEFMRMFLFKVNYNGQCTISGFAYLSQTEFFIQASFKPKRLTRLISFT